MKKAANNGMKPVLTMISWFYLCLTVNAQAADFRALNIEPDNEMTARTERFVGRDERIIQSEALIYFLLDGCSEQREMKQTADTVPPNGTYRFDIAFAEWQGKSMDEKVTVMINGDSIRVIYEGDGQLGGEGVLENGKIMKHKSGVWIIGNDPSDIQLDEVGGCTGGPSIIDFKNKKYWMC